MKPTPKYDFPVNVSREADEHALEVAQFYRGMFDVQLNHVVSIHVVPNFSHEVWPPSASDAIASELDACRHVVSASRYSVTPSEKRGGATETFVDADGGEHTLFLTTTTEHLALVSELSVLAEAQRSSNDSVLVTELASPSLQRLLLERILPSGAVAPYVMSMLGR